MLPDPQRQQNQLPMHYNLGARELITVCWRRKWYFVLSLAAALALGAVYFVRADRLYQVSARLLVEKQGLPLGRAPENQEKEFLATQAEIIGSPAVVAGAAKDLEWPAPLPPDVSPVNKLLANLDVRPVMGTQVIGVSYRSGDVRHAREAVERVIASYREYLRDAEQDTYLETLRLLTQNERELRDDLQELQHAYRDLRKASPVTGSGKNGADVQILLVEQLGQKLTETRNRRIELENQLASVRSAGLAGDTLTNATPRDNPLASDGPRGEANPRGEVRVERAVAQLDDEPPPIRQVAATRRLSRASLLSQLTLPDGTDIGGIQSQLAEAQLRETDLAERYGYKHADLRAARQQIADLEGRLQEVLDAAPAILEQQLTSIEASEERLGELYRTEVAKAKEIDSYLLEEQQALDHIERVRTLHDTVLTQLRESELTSQALADGRSGVRVSVLEAPDPPNRPLWPSPLVLAVVCTAVGLAGAAGLVVFAEYRKPTYPRTAMAVAPPSDFDDILGGPQEERQHHEQPVGQFN